MKVNNAAFYELMGDYHWYMCGHYWRLQGHMTTPNAYIMELADYHRERYLCYDDL